MNFGEAIELIGDQTARPELDTLIRARINGFVRMISLSGHYWPDRVETQLMNSVMATVFTFANPTRFRSVDYIKYQDRDKQIDRKEPSKLHRDPISETDIWYLAGSNIRIISAREIAGFDFSYWTYPADMSKNDDTNWIMTNLGITIVDMVSELIFTTTGERTESLLFQQLQRTELQILVEDILGDHTPSVMSGRA